MSTTADQQSAHSGLEFRIREKNVRHIRLLPNVSTVSSHLGKDEINVIMSSFKEP